MAKGLRIVLAMLMAVPAASVAADWLQFGYDPAHSANNPDETSINAGNVKYLRPLYSVGLVSPADLTGLSGTEAAPVYLSGVVRPDGLHDVLFVTLWDAQLQAIDAATGETLWSKQPPSVGSTRVLTTATTPAIDPSRSFVYSYGLDGKVHKYSVGDGTETIDSEWPKVSTLKPTVEHSAAALSIGKSAVGNVYLYAVTKRI